MLVRRLYRGSHWCSRQDRNLSGQNAWLGNGHGTLVEGFSNFRPTMVVKLFATINFGDTHWFRILPFQSAGYLIALIGRGYWRQSNTSRRGCLLE